MNCPAEPDLFFEALDPGSDPDPSSALARSFHNIFRWWARSSVINLLQSANQAWTSVQREVPVDYPVASSFLHSLLNPATAVLQTPRVLPSRPAGKAGWVAWLRALSAAT